MTPLWIIMAMVTFCPEGRLEWTSLSTHSKPAPPRFLPFRQHCCGLHLLSCGERLLLQSVHWQEVSPNITGSAQKCVLRRLPQHTLSVTCDETAWAHSFSVKVRSVNLGGWVKSFDCDICRRAAFKKESKKKESSAVFCFWWQHLIRHKFLIIVMK